MTTAPDGQETNSCSNLHSTAACPSEGSTVERLRLEGTWKIKNRITPDKRRDDHMSVPHLADVLEVVNELAKRASVSDYVYRGESKCNPQVSSNLYRKYEDIDDGGFHIGIVQSEMLQAAKQFIVQTDDNDVLAQLQHFGGRTNLIDFTSDYNIALFFACDGHPDNDGRVILLEKHLYPLRRPVTPSNRVIAQKSIFVEPPSGTVVPSDTLVVPRGLKAPILSYLRAAHDISAETIYNDVHGFIRYQNIHGSAYVELYLAS